MPDQLTIRLPEEMNRALEAASNRLQRRRSEVVRMALSQFLGLEPQGTEETPAARVRNLIGALDTGIPDLAENHRAYILESLKNGR